MPRFIAFLQESTFFEELREYFAFLYKYIRIRGYTWFSKFELMKDFIVDLLYRRRGKYARPFLHFGTIALIFVVITFGPLILEQRQREDSQAPSASVINLAQAYGNDLSTSESERVRQFRGGEITVHTVQEGETLSSIADKYGLHDVNTLLWENELAKNAKLKPGDLLRILPVDGLRHKVQRGENIHMIAKKYGLDEDAGAQAIVDYPFNEFKNDETFDLTIGQLLMVPGGEKPDAQSPSGTGRSAIARTLTPDAGTVSASGSFAWPVQGVLSQRYSFYHKAYDIANRVGTPILAADSGTVIVAGWIDSSGYANRVIIDHGNGYVTLYAHMSLIQVQVGQKVARGNVIGQVGCTGRCTGPHVHFEIRHGGVLENPAKYLR
jgi:murein DD-endopeptidase MepM/ murein hydrolase activator NlpD